MNFDDFQKSWQSQDTAKKISFNADVLLNEVRRKQLCLRRMIFWRDVREVGVAALLVPVFIAGGLMINWTLHLCAFSCFVVGAYFVVDRWRQKKKTPDLHGSLKDCTATSLAEVRHQIWLLKNILWWYLLSFFVPIMVFFSLTGRFLKRSGQSSISSLGNGCRPRRSRLRVPRTSFHLTRLCRCHRPRPIRCSGCVT